MVIDLSQYLDDHPGGKFSLEHSIGKDISKYFHGGYSLENQNKVNEHLHSKDALFIVR